MPKCYIFSYLDKFILDYKEKSKTTQKKKLYTMSNMVRIYSILLVCIVSNQVKSQQYVAHFKEVIHFQSKTFSGENKKYKALSQYL